MSMHLAIILVLVNEFLNELMNLLIYFKLISSEKKVVDDHNDNKVFSTTIAQFE